MMTQEERKARSETILRERGVSILPSLPMIESEEEARLRSPREVAHRVMALVCVAAASSGVDRSEIVPFLKAEGLWDAVSDEEQSFLQDENANDHLAMQFGWRAEAIWLLLWALGLVETLELPVDQCSVEDILERVPSLGDPTEPFISSAKLRSVPEILDVSDLTYRAHWATRDRGEDAQAQCGDLHPDVVVERHKAVNWLTCYENLDWDEVTTDT